MSCWTAVLKLPAGHASHWFELLVNCPAVHSDTVVVVTVVEVTVEVVALTQRLNDRSYAICLKFEPRQHGVWPLNRSRVPTKKAVSVVYSSRMKARTSGARASNASSVMLDCMPLQAQQNVCAMNDGNTVS